MSIATETRPESVAEGLDTTPLLERIQRNCLLVSMQFRRWSGQYQIDGARVTLDETPLDATKVTAPRWKLLPEQWKQRFGKLESKARGTVQRYSVPFSLAGVHIVPLARSEALFRELRGIRDELAGEVRRFLANYDELVGRLRKEMGPVFSAVARHLPSREALVERFAVTWAVVPLDGQRPGRGLDEWELSDYLSEARAAMQKMVAESVEAMVRQPREELAAAVGNLADLLGRGGVVRSGTLERIRRSYEKLRGFAFLADDQLIAQMRQVEGRLGGLTAQELNKADQRVAVTLGTALRRLQEECSREEAAVAAFNRFTRGIDL